MLLLELRLRFGFSPSVFQLVSHCFSCIRLAVTFNMYTNSYSYPPPPAHTHTRTHHHHHHHYHFPLGGGGFRRGRSVSSRSCGLPFLTTPSPSTTDFSLSLPPRPTLPHSSTRPSPVCSGGLRQKLTSASLGAAVS